MLNWMVFDLFKKTYENLLDSIKDGKKSVLITFLSSSDRNGDITKKLLLTEDNIVTEASDLDSDIYEKASSSLETGELQFLKTNENKAILIEPFFPKPRLIIFGGGHIAKPLVEFGAKVGFSITVIDDRPFFANSSRFPEADEVICKDFKSSFDSLKLRSSDFVVIVTRGHRHDGVVLREILNHSLRYVGMIGSKRRVKGLKEELIKEGFSKTKLDEVNTPIGLDIGAITPEEIAISIIAEVISYRRKTLNTKYNKELTWPEFDKDVIEKVCEESEMPKALITIISSKGSVPRKSGAKMIAYFHGRTYGSIGGGCSEAGVLAKARDIMIDKGFLIEHVDMTGDVAEDEGMVCGGVMDILIESF